MRVFVTLCLFASLLSVVMALPAPRELRLFSTAGNSTFCSRFTQQCVTSCSSLNSTATAVSTCKANSAILKRAALGSLNCKCGTTDVTSSVVSALFKPLSAVSQTAASTSSVSAASSSQTSSSQATGTTQAAISGSGIAPLRVNNVDVIGVWTSASTTTVSSSATVATASPAALNLIASNSERLQAVKL